MAGHYHHNDASLTQNQGNHVGDRPCVRQSRTYRAHNGGNAMKDIMGQGNLAWDTENMQGAYTGAAHPGHSDGTQTHGHQSTSQQNYQQPPPQQQQQPPQQQAESHWSHHQEQQPSAARAQPAQQQAHWSHHQEQQLGAAQPSAHRGRPGAGAANRTTYNFMTGQ